MLTRESLVWILGIGGGVGAQVLLAMVGKGGALISISASEAKVRGEAEFLLEQERELIARAAGIGRNFFILEDFTRRVRAGDKGLREGLYIRALAAGIDEVLAVYRSMVLELEREVLSDSTTPLTRIETATSDWELLLPALCKIAGALESGDVHGCKILDLVAEHSTSGVPAVRGVAERLLARLGIVLYSQVAHSSDTRARRANALDTRHQRLSPQPSALNPQP